MKKIKRINLPDPDRLMLNAVYLFLTVFPLALILINRYSSRELIIVVLWYCSTVFMLLPIIYEKKVLKVEELDWFSPVLFNIYTSFMGIFRPFFLIRDNWSTTWLEYFQKDLVVSLMIEAMFLTTVSNLFYFFGYYNNSAVRFGKRIRPLPRELNRKQLKIAAIFIFLFSFMLFILLLKDSGGVISMLHSMGRRREAYLGKHYIIMGLLLMPLGVWLVLAYYLVKDKKLKLTYFIIIGLAVIVASTLGGRGNMGVIGVVTIMIYHYSYKKISLYTLIAIFVIAIPFFTLYLNFRESQKYSDELVFDALEEKKKVSFIDRIFNSGEGTDRLIVLLNGVPERIPFQYFTTYSRIFTTVIPRSIWPEKPALSFASVYAGLFNDLHGNNKNIKEEEKGMYPAGSVGDYYLQLGIAAVMILSFLRGYTSRMMYEYLKKNKDNAAVIVLYGIALSTNVFKLRNLVIVQFLFKSIPFLILVKLVAVRRKGKPKVSIQPRGTPLI